MHQLIVSTKQNDYASQTVLAIHRNCTEIELRNYTEIEIIMQAKLHLQSLYPVQVWSKDKKGIQGNSLHRK